MCGIYRVDLCAHLLSAHKDEEKIKNPQSLNKKE